jgi:hypothetical protein
VIDHDALSGLSLQIHVAAAASVLSRQIRAAATNQRWQQLPLKMRSQML